MLFRKGTESTVKALNGLGTFRHVGLRALSGAGVKPGTPVPVNLMKDGQDPVVKEDAEYPEWLFELNESKERLELLFERREELTWRNGGSRFFREKNTIRIKENNIATKD